MALSLTNAQTQRIKELDAASEPLMRTFQTEDERESYFADIVTDLTARNRNDIRHMAAHPARSDLSDLKLRLQDKLTGLGFLEVHTPTIISEHALAMMGMDSEHPLRQQVFWLEGGRKCLRPMLAPNLYVVMKNISRANPGRFGLFEIGTCFRKESRGTHHLEEFTMLNLVEVRPAADPRLRFSEIVRELGSALGLPFDIQEEGSEIYGSTLDVVVDGVEVASAAFGPHPLDKAFRVDFPWMGIGMGLERLLMVGRGTGNIRRHASSLVYLNGRRTDI